MRVQALRRPEYEEHRRGAEMLAAACSEAGYPTRPMWVNGTFAIDPTVPDAVLQKARLLVCEALGWEYEVYE